MLTHRQRDVLRFVEAYQVRNDGVSPSVGEISMAVGLKSRGHAQNILRDLEYRGFVRRLRNRWRAIEVIKKFDGTKAVERYRVFKFDDEMKKLVEI